MNGWYEDVPSYSTNSRGSNYIETMYGVIYTGVRWQCVEFIRRYLIIRHGITFQPIENAYDFIQLSHFIALRNSIHIPIQIFTYYKYSHPRPHDIIVLHYKKTGHIGIISHYDVKNKLVYIVDQNKCNSNGKKCRWDTHLYSCVYPVDSIHIVGWIRWK